MRSAMEYVVYTFGGLFVWAAVCRLYYMLTGMPGKVAKQTFRDGRKLTVIRGDMGVKLIHKEIFVEKCYFRHGVSLAGVKEPLIVDVGGNVGFFSVYCAEQFKGAEIHLFEPVPMLIECCRKNLQKFGAVLLENNEYKTADRAPSGTNVHLYKLALGSESTEVDFSFDPRASAGSGMVDNAFDTKGNFIGFVRAVYLDGIQAETIPAFPTRPICALLGVPVLKYFVFVAAIPLLVLHTIFVVAGGALKHNVKATVAPMKDVLKARGLEGRKIDFLKVDVEGAEWMVLQGMSDATWDAVQQCVVEVHDGKEGRVQQVMDLLKAKGFKNIHREDDEFEIHRVIGLSTVYATRQVTKSKSIFGKRQV